MVDDVELVNAIRLVRAQQGKQTILTGGRVNGPGQDDLACEAVCATRAIIWSREGVFATRAHSSGRALIILIACEAVVATRAQTSWASIDNSKGTVFAKKAQSSQVSFDNNHNT